MTALPRATAMTGCVAALFSLSLSSTARAARDELPVIAVNREIGLSALGSYTGTRQRDHYQDSDAYTPNGTDPWYTGYSNTNSSVGETKKNSWLPGFEANAQYMTDIGRLKHLYIAGTFDLSSGDESTTYREEETAGPSLYYVAPIGASLPSSIAASGPVSYRGREDYNRSAINTWGEIGKGFLLAHDRLLLTPTIQGGYSSYGVGSYTAFGSGYVGLALHADYALTNRLVLRARADWAQMLNTHEHFGYDEGAYRGDSRPIWRGEIGLDYRATRHLHVTGGVRYSHIDFGTAHSRNSGSFSDAWGSYSWNNEARAHGLQNGVNLRLGLAYGF